MSLTEEIRLISEISEIDSVKTKRASRRRQLTKIKRKFEDAIKDKSLKEVQLSDLQDLLPSCKEARTLHEALQERYDQLRDETTGLADGERSEEIEKDEDLLQSHDNLFRNLSKWVRRVQFYQRGIILCESLSSLIDLGTLSSPTIIDEIQDLKKKVAEFLTDSMDFADDDSLSPLRRKLQDDLRAINLLLVSEHGKTSHSESSTSSKSSSSKGEAPLVSAAKLNIELPKFSGKPTEWTDFYTLFTASIEKRGAGLSDPERCCLLLNAMSTEEAKRIVHYYQSGPDSYKAALKALTDAYGQPQMIYPHHVKALLTSDHYTYDRRSLRHMRETFEINMRGMERVKGNSYQQFLAAILIDRFDTQMMHEWTTHAADSTTLPGIDEILTFFRKREFSLPDEAKPESSKISKAPRHPISNPRPKTTHPVLKVNTSNATPHCPVCSSDHTLSKCSTFLAYDPPKRHQVVKDKRHCTNCLSHSHSQSRCQSSYNCRKCGQRHHTLLHRETRVTTPPPEESNVPTCVAISPADVDEEPQTVTAPQPGLLNTAVVDVINGSRTRRSRIAMDPGAAISLISESLASSLKLTRHPHRFIIDGILGDGQSKSYVQAKLKSIFSDESITIKFCVVPKIPSSSSPRNPDEILKHPSVKDKVPLADPSLGGSLDALIGALDVIKCQTGSPVYSQSSTISATPTMFGWTIVGPLNHSETKPVLKVQVKEDSLHQSLQQLWELDRLPDEPVVSSDDKLALHHFDDTHAVQPDGRYVVKLPRVQNPPELGESRSNALRRFHQNERSLRRKGKLDQFNAVVKEYLTLDHAEEISTIGKEDSVTAIYYMPIHGVIKDSSTTTKLRAVFDASSPSTSGISLNDTLLAGPNLYPLLTDILLRFRLHKIAFSADIGKMFREVVLHADERNFHRFLHRDESGKVKDYRMKRLTFGVKSSPFLATRVIRHLAESNHSSHPLAAKAILNDFYVDDFLSGTSSTEEAERVREQLCDLLKTAGMNLRKWRSNSLEFRNLIPQDLLETSDLKLPSPLDSSKTLGMHWDVAQDTFHIAVPSIEDKPITKRTVASISAKVYDVLGLFAPATILSKMLLQDLWSLQLNWDTAIPEDLAQKWRHWTSELTAISNKPVPRRIVTADNPVIFQALHGFADASTLAYGAVIYLRSVHQDMTISTSLVYAKARVAPLKSTTIPRLELVGAHLLSQLLQYVAKMLKVPIEHTFAWSDSMIVLCWLRKHPSTLKTFVSHRVAAIQQVIPAKQWYHVSSKDNPADLLSRGMSASLLANSELWWKGPLWLRESPSCWPKTPVKLPPSIPESKVSVNLAIPPPQQPNSLWKRYSSFSHLVRVVTVIRRFVNNAGSSKAGRLTGALTSEEIHSSRVLLLRQAQQETYASVFEILATGKKLPIGHSLSKYDLSLDTDRLLRISGRVRQSENFQSPKYLIPLSLKSSLTQLLVSTHHMERSHPGISTSLAILAETYYIPNLRNYLKKVSRQCSICQKAYARPLAQRMGLLPLSRTTPAPPFHVTGIDFAGPFQVKQGYTRKPVIVKAYACVFVCFTTRAVHLEVCADLTTEEFMAALQRFCARRGTPAQIHSDNGTNFQGARNEIRELQRLTTSETTQQAISHFITKSSVQWHFIPPRTPHFGGLWESAVCSMKTLLRKLVRPHILTFQELATVLTEAEAVINSRPLAPAHATDAEDTLVLTAGHFLIGRPLKALPQTDINSTSNLSSLKRWNLVRRLNQDLWIAWSSRYIQSLQARSKWKRPSYNFKIGDVVIVKDEMLKQRSWPLARVVETYPGDDGLVRTVDIRCQDKIYRRSTNRLVLLTEDQPPPPRMSGTLPTSSIVPEDPVPNTKETLNIN